MKKNLIAIIGTGGFAKEVSHVAIETLRNLSEENLDDEYELVYVETTPENSEFNGRRLLSISDFIKEDAPKKFSLAIADSRVRMNLSGQFLAAGCQPLQLVSKSARVSEMCHIGHGAILCDNVIITANAQIGKFFHANIFSYIAHDCEIGDYVTFAPRVSCNGNVRIEDYAYLGTGAIIKQGKQGAPITIGEGAIVGMGAVVTRDVAPYTTVVGNPARILTK